MGKQQYISTLELLHGHFLGLSVRNDALIDLHPNISQISELLDKVKHEGRFYGHTFLYTRMFLPSIAFFRFLIEKQTLERQFTKHRVDRNYHRELFIWRINVKLSLAEITSNAIEDGIRRV